MVDVSQIPDVKKYDEVIIFGDKKDNCKTADEVAESVGSIGYELTCGINRRVPRVYIKNGKVIKIKGVIYDDWEQNYELKTARGRKQFWHCFLPLIYFIILLYSLLVYIYLLFII